MTLNEVMKETAEAIREKTGKSELIAPVDFASEIKGITAGGGESGDGGSSWRYFDFSNITLTGVQSYAFKSILAMIGKFDIDGAKIIAPPSTYIIEGGREFMANCIAGGIETSAKCNGEGELMDWNSYLEALGLNDSGLADMGITEITEEEFYDLNA
jgi:hypothetical protein